MVQIFINSLKNLTKGTSVTICTLPEAARPYNHSVYFSVGSPTANPNIRIAATPGGSLLALLYDNNEYDNITFTFTYIR